MKGKTGAVIGVTRLESGAIKIDVKDAGEVAFDPAKASAANREYAAFHGWKQRLVDAAALSRDTTNGAVASPADKLAAIKELVDHYESGSADWSRAGTGDGGKSLTLEAIARVQGCTYDEAEANVAAYAKKKFADDTKKALAFLRQGAKVMAAIDAIRKERAK